MDYAEASCILKVKPNCIGCKMKTMEILGSVNGIYDVSINSEEGWARVEAVVEPNLFMATLSRPGVHAQPKWVKMQHPKINSVNYDAYRNGYGYGHGYGHGYGAIDDPHFHAHAQPDYHYSMMNPGYHGYGSNPYCHGLNQYDHRPAGQYYHGSGPILGRSYAHRRHGPFNLF